MYVLLNMHVGIGELMRTAPFKDKALEALGIKSAAEGAQDDEIEHQIIGTESNKRVNAGLLTYPTPDGRGHPYPESDQSARRQGSGTASGTHPPVCPQIQLLLWCGPACGTSEFQFRRQAGESAGLDGSGKMGKSEGNCIYLIDEEKHCARK